MKPKHEPCRCGCGELSDECGRNPLGAFTITNERRCDFRLSVDESDPAYRGNTFCIAHGRLWPCMQRPAGDNKAQAAYHPEEET